ncbi:hypothetical protein C9374_001700 [Naegleria lovaniensis]|uniref:Uncharacterized protein n=1 Tax=Naegleria lovaniensis TaxID=51637 RepID=A0AA88KM90_NAELO|nr:uncharacterized protein C9374_001700 [Naegleria lovaniensis]KAG2387368.1 hypothetical protein C9374_001700 [Naegleria lovaniensis]
MQQEQHDSTSLDDTWTISDLSSHHGVGSLRNSLSESISKKKLIERPVFSPISSMDSGSDKDEDINSKPVKPFLKRATGGYKEVTVIKPQQHQLTSVNITNNNPMTSPSISTTPIIVKSTPASPNKLSNSATTKNSNLTGTSRKKNDASPILSLSDEITKSQTMGPELYSIPKSNLQGLATANHLRGYEIAPPKVVTHMDFLEFKKFQQRKREFEIVPESNKKKKDEDQKKEMKIPEALYTYLAPNTPPKKEIPVKTEKDEGPHYLEKIPSKPTRSQSVETKLEINDNTRKIRGRRMDEKVLQVTPSTPPIVANSSSTIDSRSSGGMGKAEKQKEPLDRNTLQKSIEKVTTITNNTGSSNLGALKNMENAIKDSEQKLTTFQKMLDKLLEQKEREYENILSKTTNQVSSTITNSMSKMGIDIRTFYKQFEKLQRVTSEITTKFGKQLSDDQKKSQTLLNKQMKQIEDIGRKIELMEKKANQIKDQKPIKFESKTISSSRMNRSIFDVTSTKELSMEEIHTDMLKKHPSLFKSPNWSEISQLSTLEIYQAEQKYLIDELVGSFDSSAMKQLSDVVTKDDSSILNKSCITIDEKKNIPKIKIQTPSLKPMPLLLPQEISSDEIQRLYPDFAKNLLKFSILSNEEKKSTLSVKNNTTVVPPPCEAPALDVAQESLSSKEDMHTPEVIKLEVEIQTDNTEEAPTPSVAHGEESQERLSPSKDIPSSSIETRIETCDVGWNKKDNSGKLFQDQIDHMVAKEINTYEKEQIIKQLLPKETKVLIPPLDGANDDGYDGISFTSHYPQRVKKPEERNSLKMPNEYNQEKRPLDILFEEYANTLVERTIKHIAHGLLSEFLQQTSSIKNNQEDQEDRNVFDDEQLSSIKGGALCAELFVYCIENGIPFDDALVYKATEELIWDFVKNKFPIFTSHDGEKEEEVVSNTKSNANETLEREAICELVLRLLTSYATSNRHDKEKHVEREHASQSVEAYKDISSVEKEPVVPKVAPTVVPLEPVKKVILYGIETQTDTFEPQSVIPQSIQTELETQTMETQTFFETKKEESCCQTSELKRSISEAQTDKLFTQTVHTETDTKKLLIEPHFGIGIPPKIPDVKNVQTSFLQPSINKSSTSASNTSQYEEETESSSSYVYVTETEEEENQAPKLPKTKLFASVTENDIERMLKLQLLKRSLGVKKHEYPSVRKPYHSDDSDTSFLSSEDSFIESSREEASISTFYTSESSRGLDVDQDFSSTQNSTFEDLKDYCKEHDYTSSTTRSSTLTTAYDQFHSSTGYFSSVTATTDSDPSFY